MDERDWNLFLFSQMSDEATGKSGKAWLYYIGSVLLLPVLYFLSSGPAAVLVQQSIFSRSAFDKGFAPVIWLIETTGTAGPADACIRAWLSLTGSPLP